MVYSRNFNRVSTYKVQIYFLLKIRCGNSASLTSNSTTTHSKHLCSKIQIRKRIFNINLKVSSFLKEIQYTTQEPAKTDYYFQIFYGRLATAMVIKIFPRQVLICSTKKIQETKQDESQPALEILPFQLCGPKEGGKVGEDINMS